MTKLSNPRLLLGGTGPGRPTSAQWRTLHRLIQEAGWSGGVYEPGFPAMIEQQLGLSAPRFMTREAMDVIIANVRGYIQWGRTGVHPGYVRKWENTPRAPRQGGGGR